MVESEIKSCIGKIQKFAQQKKDLSEEDLRAYFIKTDILRHLGYKGIGEDISLEKTIHKKGKRPDIQCVDDYGNVIFVVEFKKPSDESDLKSHFNQLWERYVLPLKAKYGILTNGLRMIIYERIGVNSSILLDKNLSEINEEDCKTFHHILRKPHYELTLIKEIMEYFDKFSVAEERRALNTELARELFYEDFMLKEKTAFSELVQRIIQLFDYQYGKSKFLTSAYEFWLKSYAKKPDKIPKSWGNLLKDFGLNHSKDDLNKFMFCLETAYALFTRLILAKAWEYTLQSVGKRFGYEATWSFIEIVQAVYQEQLTGFRPEHTAVQATLLSEINELYQMSDLRDSFKKHCLRPLSQISLTQEKVAGDKERAHTTLKRIEQHALIEHFRYRVEQGWGRYYALCASYEAAFKHYQKAVEHGLYRAGPVLREILRELLVLAVVLDEPAIIKRYYRWSCVMGLFSGEGDAPEDWEIKALRKAFLNEFPLAGLYQG